MIYSASEVAKKSAESDLESALRNKHLRLTSPCSSTIQISTDNEDCELLSSLKTDSQAAFKQLYDKYWRKLYNVAYNRLRDITLSEDLTQDVFLDLWDKRRTLLIQQSLNAYLYASIKNKVMDQIRKSVTRKNFVQHILATTTNLDRATEHRLAHEELEDMLAQQVRQLPSQRRRIFELSRRDHLSYVEIAQRLHLSPKTVENQLSRALKTLRWQLRELLILAVYFTVSQPL